MRDLYQKKTCQTLFFYGLLGEPLFTLCGFIPYILCNNLGANGLQIALLTTLKPVVSLFSFYWSASLKEKGAKLRSNLVYASFLARVPFLFFPFISSSWFLIGSSAIYLLFSRAAIPAWSEVLRLNLPEESRGKAFSWSFSFSYLEGMGLSLAVGAILDQNQDLWRWLFFLAALIGMAGVYLIFKLPIKHIFTTPLETRSNSFQKKMMKPWKDTYSLLKTRPDFALFQWGFMVCGFGIMLVQPILPFTLIEHFQFSYMQFGIASIACKGFCIVLSSPFWGRILHRISPFTISASIFFLTALFLFTLHSAYFSPFLAYIAFGFYGIAQGGSHLLWNLSGTYFSKKEDSSSFSGVNVVMVGIRGFVAPFLGAFLAFFFSSSCILFLGALFCLAAAFLVLKNGKKSFSLDGLSKN